MEGDVMNIVSLKDEPLLKVITKITKMKWVLERQWKARKRQFIKAIIVRCGICGELQTQCRCFIKPNVHD